METDEAGTDAGTKPEQGSAPPADEAPTAESTEAGKTEPAAEPAPGAWARADTGAPEASEEVTPEAAASAQPGEARRLLLTAAVSGGVLLFALAFFMSGFWVHALLDEDGNDGGSTVTADSAKDDPAWGPEGASVTIEEFADFECPYCSRYSNETLPRIKEEFGDKVRYIYRDFPISNIHPYAQKAAEAGQCAHEQGEFWEYHDVLFENQDALAASDLVEYAQGLDLDMAEFNDCLDSSKNAWEVMMDMRDGGAAGVSGTPAFLINGLLISGAQPYEQFQAIIEQALAAGE